MRNQPLESPRALPTAVQPLARAAGVTGTPRFTTGPRTRAALGAAGALGATTGAVVHLPSTPDVRWVGAAHAPSAGRPDPAQVLRHELSHAARPVSRPRFLLAGAPGGGGDDEERSAAAAGLGRSPAGPDVSSGLVGSMPVGRAAPAGFEQAAQRAVTEALRERTPGGWPGSTAAPLAAPRAGQLPDAAAATAVAGASPAIAAGGLIGPTGAAAATVGGVPAGAANATAALDVDALVDALEQRLLHEIERRGGRWTEVF